MTAPTPEYGGCLWPMDTACAGGDWATTDLALRDRAHRLASSTLTRLTGGRVSDCPITVRPCKPQHAWNSRHGFPFYSGHPFTPSINDGGAWINSGCCTSSACACTATCSVPLPRPVGRVDQVKVDGVILAATDYFISGDNRLVWSGTGACPFPATQDLSKPDTAEGTFSVTYLNAWPVDSMGACSVAILASEFAKASQGGKCRLPANVTSIVRQGITMEVNTGAFPDGTTGIREVDAYIAMWNPNGLQRGSSVWTPDLHRAQVQRGL